LVAGSTKGNKKMQLKIGSDPNRCLVTIAVDKDDLFEVMRAVLSDGLAQVCGIEEAPTVFVEKEKPLLRRV
jgi:hypothetical protein